MANCERCQQPLSPSSRFCTGCGNPVTDPTGGASAPSGVASSTGPGFSAFPTSPSSSAMPPAPPPVSASDTGPITTIPPSAAVYPPAASADQGFDLAPGETILHQAYFTPYLLRQHLKSQVLLTDKRLVVSHPMTIFALIPAGYVISSAPYSHVQRLDCGTLISTRRLTVGAALALAALLSLTEPGRLMFGGGFYNSDLTVTGVLFFLLLAAGAAICFITARKVGMFFSAGEGLVAIRSRGHELPTVRDTAHKVVSLLRSHEPQRSL